MTLKRRVGIGETEAIETIEDGDRIVPRYLIAETSLTDCVIEIQGVCIEVVKERVTTSDGECRARGQERVKLDERRIEQALPAG